MHRALRRTIRVVVVAALVGLLGAASPAARLVYGLLWVKPVVEMGPCLFTVALPANRAEGCIPWTRRETSGPAFHAPSGLVIAGGSDGRLRAINATNGDVVYATETPGAVVARPTLSGPRAYMGTDDGHVVRVDVTSGRITWDSEVDGEVSEPVVRYGDAVYAVTGLDSLYAFDEGSGATRWVHRHALPRGITLRGQGRPLVASVQLEDGSFEERVFVGHASGTLFALDPATGEPLQQVDLARSEAFNDLDSDPVLQAGNLIVASHATGLFALDPVTLAERWTLAEKGIVRVSTAGPFMIVAAAAGTVLGIDARNGSIRWRFTYEKGSPTRLHVKGGRVHFGSDRGPLYVLDLFSGRPLQYYGSGLGVAADLDLVGDMLFMISTAGSLHALSNDFHGPAQRKRR